ncbi:HEAT repeat domain-containing protein [Nocardioides perillae]|uniref:HEAT repeat protein n=1 Tax=Nocardioides perillae TaxID=1119534 RepID=A0A7Y9RRV0_9ACTN|nr:HEAT repeat protein [Nocardioides perillae]
MDLGFFALVAGVLLALLCVGLVLALVAVRLGTGRAERRRAELRTPVWRLVLTMTTGEDDEVDEALAGLERASRSEVAVVEADAFGLLPKLRGASQERLRQLLRHWGSAARAEALVGSWSAVRRCRGLYRLGMLADPASLPLVLDRLGDRDFAVRRVAVQALGSLGDASAVRPALDLVAGEPVLRRDLLAALSRIGAASAPVLEQELVEALAGVGGASVTGAGPTAEAGASDELRPEEARARRRAQLSAEGLGLVDAVGAAPVLARAALEVDDVPLQTACLDALGRLGSPAGSTALEAGLGHPVAEVRRTAAQALGLLGGPRAVPALTPVLEDPAVEVARAAAQALGRSGPAGAAALEESTAPVARETVALAALGTALR